MRRIFSTPARRWGGYTRRELLRVGGLSLLGLTVGELARLRAGAMSHSPAARYRHNSCVFIFLFGGPSQVDLWDMKPEAPAEIRGEFTPVSTNVPGIHLCEHLPLLARQMDKFCLLRSMTHHMPVHGPACSEMFTGREYPFPPTTDQARPEDWPSLSALAMRYGSHQGGLPPSIVLPWYIQFAGQAKRIAGQTGGRMGEHHNAFLVQGDPSKPGFEVQGLKLPDDVAVERLLRRRDLLRQLESTGGRALEQGELAKNLDTHYEQAFSMIVKSQAAGAFDLDREPASLRARYGNTKFAQSLLLARRLVEAGVSLITVNWDDETKYDKVSPFWDTHHQNFPKLKNHLCPLFDRCFSTFLQDLDQRGLLETTLVVVTGEFGRTPKVGMFTQNNMTQKTGRDHWPHAFTVLLAGGGVRGGQVYGATNKSGGYVKDQPVTPADLAATVFYHLGIDITRQYKDEFQRIRQRLCEGTPITDLG